jgi:lipopolysaccharide transport system permease protein
MSSLREIVAYRSLFKNLVKRDLKVRYKNSLLGFFWSLLNPFLMMVVFTVVFSKILRFNIPNYPAFLMVGFMPWLYLATSLSQSVQSVVGSGPLLGKVYFPREVLPLSTVLSNLVNFLLALVPLSLFLLALGVRPGWHVALLPAVIVVQTLLVSGLALLLSALNVKLRDLGVILEVVLMAWFYLTPVFYSMAQVVEWVPSQYLRIYMLNPMTGIVLAYRWSLLGRELPGVHVGHQALLAGALSVGVFAVGVAVFQRLKKRFVEEL